ncbi:PPC domain-containing protein, partial [Thalassotalea ganghwensis]
TVSETFNKAENDECIVVNNVSTEDNHHVNVKGKQEGLSIVVYYNHESCDTTPSNIVTVDGIVNNTGEETGPVTSAVELTNGETVLSSSDQEPTNFFADVPNEATNLVFSIYGGSGEADLFVKYQATPTDNDYDGRGYIYGNDESVSIANPNAGKWYFIVKGYNNSTFHDVNVSVSWDGGLTEESPADIDNNGAVDKRDIQLFQQMLRNDELGLEYDFSGDGMVNQKDVRAMMRLCDLPRCAIAD